MKKAFTLIELLIVVAIIAILAAIAVPNFQEAQVRSKVARVLSDMRAETLALESYTVDFGVAPLHTPASRDAGGVNVTNAKNGVYFFDHVPDWNGTATMNYWPGTATIVSGNGSIKSAYIWDSGGNFANNKNMFLNPGDALVVQGTAGKMDRYLCWWEMALTTPLSYLSRRVEDIFHNKQEWMKGNGKQDSYWNGDQNVPIMSMGNFFYINYEHYAKAFRRFETDDKTTGYNWNTYSRSSALIYEIGNYRWALVSSGPSFRGNRDQISAANNGNFPFLGNKGFPAYDPTNGTRSWGYIIRTNRGMYTIDNQTQYGSTANVGIP